MELRQLIPERREASDVRLEGVGGARSHPMCRLFHGAAAEGILRRPIRKRRAGAELEPSGEKLILALYLGAPSGAGDLLSGPQ